MNCECRKGAIHPGCERHDPQRRSFATRIADVEARIFNAWYERASIGTRLAYWNRVSRERKA